MSSAHTRRSSLALLLALGSPALAQETSAGSQAGQAVQRGADSTGQALGSATQKSTDAVQGAAQTTGQTASDTWITSQVIARYKTDKLLKGSSVHVKTKSGDVLLTGKVPSQAAEERAVSIAQGTKGVENVSDQLTVTP